MTARSEASTLIPETIEIDGETVVLGRAWPAFTPDDDGRLPVTFEGPDIRGVLRAGRIHLRRGEAGGWVRDQAALLPAGTDPKLPALADLAAAGPKSLVVHRFGKRAVAESAEVFVKVVPPRKRDTVAERAEQGQALAALAGFAAPEVLEIGPGRITFSRVPGRSLHELGQSLDLQAWEQIWAQWAWRWHTLVHAETDGLPHHGPEDEQDILLRWWSVVSELELLPPFLAGQFADRVDQVCSELAHSVGTRRVVAHRDLHDKQILFDDLSGTLGLLDFDTAALAEPELDLSNLLVHIDLRREQRWWSRDHAAIAAMYVREAIAALGCEPDRLDAYAAATRVRLACLYLFRPRYRQLALRWAAGP